MSKLNIRKSWWRSGVQHRAPGAKTVAAIILSLCMVTAATASPAMASPVSATACSGRIVFDGAQVEFDNCPGQGVGWLWIVGTPNYGSSAWTTVHVKFVEGGTASLEANAGYSAKNDWGKHIKTLLVCNTWYVGKACTQEKTVW
ncbi:hypothetical protein ACFY36_20250 [Actinoplanes sp. NPDC000266]